jgi:hypothetical protein
MVKPTVVYGSETRAMTGMDMNRLGVWKRKILILNIMDRWWSKECGEKELMRN